MSRRSPTNDRYVAEKQDKPSGATKRSTASAKPSRPAAASVRMETNKARMTRKQKMVAENTMSKEERKAQRDKEREHENLLYTASTILANEDAQYKKLKRIWWGLLIAAVVFTALSWATLANESMGQTLSIVTLVLAYGAIIGALVMDLVVIRKRRNAFRDKVASMSDKQVNRLIEASYAEKNALEAAKKAKKAAKKAGKSAAEQQAAYDEALNAGLKGLDKKTAELAAAEIETATAKGKGKAGKVTAVAVEETENLSDEERQALEAKAAEEARLEAARKAARDFAASRRSNQK